MESDFKAGFPLIAVVCESSETDVSVIDAEGFTDAVHVGFTARNRVVVVAMRGGPEIEQRVSNGLGRFMPAEKVQSGQLCLTPRVPRHFLFAHPVRPPVR